jgi:hypothetical protein
MSAIRTSVPAHQAHPEDQAMTRKVKLATATLGLFTLAGTTLHAFQQPDAGRARGRASSPEDASAVSTYENLANAIIAIEKAEDDLVKTILLGYHAVAQRHLRMAASDEANRKAHVEGAAAEITNIANEGDAPIRAIRQRLAQAGHTHNTDVETKEDYMFVTNREKKELLSLAQRVGGMAGASADDLKKASAELTAMVEKALAEE